MYQPRAKRGTSALTYIFTIILAIASSVAVTLWQTGQLKFENLIEEPPPPEVAAPIVEPEPPKVQWTWPAVTPEPQRMWRVEPTQVFSSLPKLPKTEALPVTEGTPRGEEIIVTRRGYLPQLITAYPVAEGEERPVSTPVQLVEGSLPSHKLSLKLKRANANVDEVKLNGERVDLKRPLELSMGIPNEIEISRPNHQSEHLLMRPTPSSIKRVTVRLTQLQIAQPKITLDAMKSRARLSVIDRAQDKIVRGEKLLQINYQAGETYVLRAHKSAMIAEHWRVDTPPDDRSAYTLYFGDVKSEVGTLKLRGPSRFEVSVTALASALGPVSSKTPARRADTQGDKGDEIDKTDKTDKTDKSNSSPSAQSAPTSKPEPERVKLTKIHTVSLPAGSAVIVFYDTREQQEYRFVSPVIAQSTLTWRIRKNRQSVNPKRPWRVEGTIR